MTTARVVSVGRVPLARSETAPSQLQRTRWLNRRWFLTPGDGRLRNRARGRRPSRGTARPRTAAAARQARTHATRVHGPPPVGALSHPSAPESRADQARSARTTQLVAPPWGRRRRRTNTIDGSTRPPCAKLAARSPRRNETPHAAYRAPCRVLPDESCRYDSS